MLSGDTPLRLSQAGLRIFRAFIVQPRAQLCGADLMRETGLPSGTIYPILLRFERAGLLDSKWESEDAQTLGRPRRRLYSITRRGLAVADEALRELAHPQIILAQREA